MACAASSCKRAQFASQRHTEKILKDSSFHEGSAAVYNQDAKKDCLQYLVIPERLDRKTELQEVHRLSIRKSCKVSEDPAQAKYLSVGDQRDQNAFDFLFQPQEVRKTFE